jgi:hypothetical protein
MGICGEYRLGGGKQKASADSKECYDVFHVLLPFKTMLHGMD